MSTQQHQEVQEAEEALARAEAAALAADAKLDAEREAAAEALRRKEAADPYAEKVFVAALREVEITSAKVSVCERRAVEARAQVDTAREALRTAEVGEARRQLEAAEEELAAQDAALEALVRKAAGPVLEAIRQHRAKTREANEIRSRTDDEAWRLAPIRTRWSAACDELGQDPALPHRGVLSAAAAVLDSSDRRAWEATQPPRPEKIDLNVQAELRHRDAIGRECLERQAEEERRRERRAADSSRLSADALADLQLEIAKAAAIDAKVQRDNPEAKFTDDFKPRIG